MNQVWKLLALLTLLSVLLIPLSACGADREDPTDLPSESTLPVEDTTVPAEDSTAGEETILPEVLGTWVNRYTDDAQGWTFEETIELRPDGTYHYTNLKNGNLLILEHTEEYVIEENSVRLYSPDTDKTVSLVYAYIDGQLVNGENYFSKVEE